jgi:hypothetical protein
MHVDPDVFFPTVSADLDLARLICAGCPVALGCRQHGVASRSSGVWGGLLLDRGRRRRSVFPLETGPDITADGR